MKFVSLGVENSLIAAQVIAIGVSKREKLRNDKIPRRL
jgi:hypothetical protein